MNTVSHYTADGVTHIAAPPLGGLPVGGWCGDVGEGFRNPVDGDLSALTNVCSGCLRISNGIEQAFANLHALRGKHEMEG